MFFVASCLEPTAAETAASPVASAAQSIIQTGTLGALLVLAVAGALLAVWKLNKVNEARVKDQKETTKALIDVTTALRETLGELTGTTNALKDAVQKNTDRVASSERTVNETVRDAIRALRRFSPPGGTPAGRQGG